MKIVRVDCNNRLVLSLSVVDCIAGAASLISLHIINSQNNIRVIYKIAVADIITVLAIFFLCQNYIAAPIQQGVIPGLLRRCPFLILGGKRDNTM